MNGFAALLIMLMSTSVFAHEIQSVTQHLTLKKQKETGWQQDLIAKVDVSRKFDVGAQGTYLERFDRYEKRAGGFVRYRPSDRWSLEARYLQGKGNEILPEKQTLLSGYYALAQGLSPFVFYRDSRYSITTVHSVNFGMEIEKIPSIILIPSVMTGNATFKAPSKTDGIYNYGLRAIYYKEKKYSISVFSYKGREASQGVIGQSTLIIDTSTNGASASWHFTDAFRAEYVFDHTHYKQIRNQFLTSTLNLTWMF